MYKIVSYYEEDSDAMNKYRMRSRYLWDEHIDYTRNAILSVLAGTEDLDDIVDRLMRNQEDIGGLLAPYYNSTTVEKFIDLLKQHISIAGELLKLAKADKDLSALQVAWKENGDAIVGFLNETNPMSWPKSVVAPLWSQHMNLTIKQVMSRMIGKWVDDISAFDENHKCITDFADLLASGIISQNLEGFCK